MEDIGKILNDLDEQRTCMYEVGDDACGDVITDAIQMIEELQEQIPKWHIIKTRPLTDEEKEYYSEYPDGDIEFIYDCEMPNSDQEVLIATKWGTDKVNYCTDCGCYFEGYEDIDDVIAWTELPIFKENE